MLHVLPSGVRENRTMAVDGLVALDPWHLFTSWAQYLLLSSTYTNVLNVYAVCKMARGQASVPSRAADHTAEDVADHATRRGLPRMAWQEDAAGTSKKF